jgi:hypothetical protein
MAIAGGCNFAVVQLVFYSPGNAQLTAASLIENQTLARVVIAAALVAAIGQVGTVLYLFRLFGGFARFSATAIVMFGFVNAAGGMLAATFWASALTVATRTGAPGDADTILLLFEIGQSATELSYLFWGLWLLPMGWMALQSGAIPRPLGQLLMIGAFGYVASAFIGQLFEGSTAAVEILQVPAHVAEFWMIGYLLVNGVRRDSGSIFTGAQSSETFAHQHTLTLEQQR